MQPVGIQRGSELRLTAEDAVFSSTGGTALGGEGMAVARHQGFVVFVAGAVPGDVVTATVVRVRKNYAEAKTTRIERPSPFRTQPRCKHFGVCGGCKWQHVDYKAQLRFKQQRVVDAFERIGGFSDPDTLPIIGASDPYFYRNKMEFSFSDRQWIEQYAGSGVALPSESTISCAEGASASGGNPQSSIFLGLHVPQRYDKVLEIDECHLQSEVSNRILNFTREFARNRDIPVYSSKSESGYLRFLVVRESKRTKDLMVNVVTYADRSDMMNPYTEQLRREIPEITTIVNTMNNRKAQIAYGDIEKVYYGPGVLRERLGKYTFVVSAGSFFQTNTDQAEKLYDTAVEFAQLRPSDVVYDLYSGTGTIAIYLSEKAREVVGIESHAGAIRDAQRNVEENAVRNCQFTAGDLKDTLTKDEEWKKTHPRPDVIVTDPPRSGMHLRVVEAILKLSASRIVYVSCNPSTQARDVKILCEEKYRLVKLQPVDMFPHTYHVENVALMELR